MDQLKVYLDRLYAYNFWANNQLVGLLASLQVNEATIIRDLSHYLAAQEIWISRIQGREAEVKGVWEVYDLAWAATFIPHNHAYWQQFISQMTEADYYRLIAYKNTKGDYYETPVIDIMGHCVNHATYHRAQIARTLRNMGHTPLNTDYITYCRLVAHPALSL
jgi:uncharacterized damage-inducible protein DinB